MTGAFTHMFNGEYDNLGKALKGLWSKKGEIVHDAWRGIKGGAQGLHKIMTMDPSQIKGGLIGQGLYEGLTLRMGAGNGSSYGYERNIAPLVITRQIAYTNPLVLDTATTVGLGDMFSIKSEEK